VNGIFNFVRFVAYSVSALVIRKSWNWLTADVDPIPGTQQFDEEFYQVKKKYDRMLKKKRRYDEAYRKVR
tara:strand:+ start:224 stop:433 length:210 start_codon:yes stop_codon:yes gene_type:complete